MDWQHRRNEMVDRQVARRGVRDERVLRAMRRVPRERFVLPGSEDLAYDDSALSIADGQTISQPYIVALMAQALELKPSDRVLDVGTGSGYAAAVLAELAGEVFSIERSPLLARTAAERLRELGYRNVEVRTGDGTLGWPERAPFDAISVAASGPRVPEPLLGQLRVGGRLVIPVDEGKSWQDLVRIRRTTDDAFDRDSLGPVRFVRLIGDHGW